MNANDLIDVLYEESNAKYNTYLIVFNDFSEDEIKIRIKQDINRPNNPDDEDLISEYIINNYGYKAFIWIPIDDLEAVNI